MNITKTPAIFQRMDQYELAYCLRFNRACRLRQIEHLFAGVSRLGDGIFWYILMLTLPITQGKQGLAASFHMLWVGLLSLLLYKWLKARTERTRPCTRLEGIYLCAAPLDYYSFPSGHTLHAVAFSFIALTYFPALAWLLVPFTLLVALSRLILGLHYPTDVLAGAALGAILASVSLIWV